MTILTSNTPFYAKDFFGKSSIIMPYKKPNSEELGSFFCSNLHVTIKRRYILPCYQGNRYGGAEHSH